eukprot:gb/GECH01004371.1/.p1 GENE.gb/GECH01004371.1/~~gb/GECH01004371.1/.p1  ORF type:complete len:231 (+),score=18.09 gb/GECH01004371.1/:1-693(+)
MDSDSQTESTDSSHFQTGYITESEVFPENRERPNDDDFMVGTKRAFEKMYFPLRSNNQEPIFKARKKNVAGANEVKEMLKNLNNKIDSLSGQVGSLRKAFIKEKLQRKLENVVLSSSLDFFTTSSFNDVVKDKSNKQIRNSMGSVDTIINNISNDPRVIPGLENNWVKALAKGLELSADQEWSNLDQLIDHWRRAGGQENWILRGILQAFSLSTEDSIRSLFGSEPQRSV